jgi:phosphatidylglycerophosphate synthase
MGGPSIAELRAATQPASIFERNSGEHWGGRLYMRRLSPYLTRALIRTRLTPDAVTGLMIASGLVAAGLLTLPGLLPAVGAALAIQVQLLLDCSDGELARWRGRGSAVGVYLDRLGHHVTEAALPVALGIRADGGWDTLGGWTTLGLAVSVLVLLKMAETTLVHVARVETGKGRLEDTTAVAAPRSSGLRRARRAAGRLPFFRAFVAVEFTLLALAAAVADEIAGELAGSRALLVGLLAVAVVTVIGHLVAILASDRLR